jgi:hypothetical protein
MILQLSLSRNSPLTSEVALGTSRVLIPGLLDDFDQFPIQKWTILQ